MVDSKNKSQQEEKIKHILSYSIASILFVVALVAVVIGQKHIGPSGLCLMLAGVAVLLFLLYMYNRRFK